MGDGGVVVVLGWVGSVQSHFHVKPNSVKLKGKGDGQKNLHETRT